MPGILSFPSPSTLYGAPSIISSVLKKGPMTEPTGSTPQIWISAFFSLRNRPVPVMVPPVPAPEKKWVIRPSLWAHSSGPVLS